MQDGIFIHQSTYKVKVLKGFYMDKIYPSGITIVVRSLDINKDIFRLQKDDKELLGHEVQYFNTIDVLMYLTNNT
jgi:hypothetical protein